MIFSLALVVFGGAAALMIGNTEQKIYQAEVALMESIEMIEEQQEKLDALEGMSTNDQAAASEPATEKAEHTKEESSKEESKDEEVAQENPAAAYQKDQALKDFLTYIGSTEDDLAIEAFAYDDGQKVYDVQFELNGVHYEYQIDPADGSIKESKVDLNK